MSAPAAPSAGPPWARIAAVVALVAAAIVLVVVLTSGAGYHYSLIFQNAGQLVVGNQVQVGGVPEGSVDSIELTDHNQARIEITVDEPIAPLHEGSTAEIRSPSLSGAANRYIAINPGPNNAPKIANGAELGTTETKGIVDIDQVFDMFDAKTRKGLRNFIQGQATQYAGAEAGVQASSHYFSPALSTTDELFAKLIQDRPAFQRFLSATGNTMHTLAERAPAIEQLVANGNQALAATASQEAALQQGVAALPGTFSSGTGALRGLDQTLPSLTKLVTATKTATPGLAPFLVQLRGLLTTSTPVLTDLTQALNAKGQGLVSATNDLPALQREIDPSTKYSLAALRQLVPQLQFARPYIPDLVSALRGFGQASGNYDAIGHYIHGGVDFGNFSYDGGDPGTLTAVPPSQSLVNVQFGQSDRCPGSATQPAADGSSPWKPAGVSCTLSQVPPS
jgi:phospholipid/cholesterol/gamma-HCH transport system substrate-binding protein